MCRGSLFAVSCPSTRAVPYIVTKPSTSAPDPRSEEEKRRYDEGWRRQDRARWHGRSAFETMVNRSAFRLYRKLERFLARKGLVPQERPMWFVTENEPR